MEACSISLANFSFWCQFLSHLCNPLTSLNIREQLVLFFLWECPKLRKDFVLKEPIQWSIWPLKRQTLFKVIKFFMHFPGTFCLQTLGKALSLTCIPNSKEHSDSPACSTVGSSHLKQNALLGYTFVLLLFIPSVSIQPYTRSSSPPHLSKSWQFYAFSDFLVAKDDR